MYQLPADRAFAKEDQSQAVIAIRQVVEAHRQPMLNLVIEVARGPCERDPVRRRNRGGVIVGQRIDHDRRRLAVQYLLEVLGEDDGAAAQDGGGGIGAVIHLQRLLRRHAEVGQLIGKVQVLQLRLRQFQIAVQLLQIALHRHQLGFGRPRLQQLNNTKADAADDEQADHGSHQIAPACMASRTDIEEPHRQRKIAPVARSPGRRGVLTPAPG